MQYFCEHCKKSWNYPVEVCIFCGRPASPNQKSEYHVIGYSRVFIPSTGNEKVPYFVNILENKQGHKIVKKSFEEYAIGEIFPLEEGKKQDLHIGIIGTGLLGKQIATYLLQYGYSVFLKTRNASSAESARKKIQQTLLKQLDEKDAENRLTKLNIILDYTPLLNCDIIIEAVAEDLTIKRKVFQELSNICRETAILASNSSSLSIDAISEGVKNPERCIGIHFFNPVHKMDLVEIIIGGKTSPDTIKETNHFVETIYKKPVNVKNSPGFIVNRLLLPQINAAIRMLEEGIATRDDIDKALKLGLNHPMGPFELADFIGLDICLSILQVLETNFSSPEYTPANLLSTMVSQGKLGIKSGEGFYKYERKK